MTYDFKLGKNPCPRCRRNGRDRRGDNFHWYGEGQGGSCFTCGYTIPSDAHKEQMGWTDSENYSEKELPVTREALTEEEKAEVKELTGTRGMGYRGIRDETSRFFGVRYEYDAETGQPVAQYFPTTIDSELVGYRIRRFPKDFSHSIGKVGKEVELLGQFRFKTHSKTCVIVGGETKLLNTYQILKDDLDRKGKSDWEVPAVVASTLGEPGAHKQVQEQYGWISRFERVIICMDADEAGREAAEKIAAVLPRGKAYIMTMRHKDVDDYVVDKNGNPVGKEHEFIRDYWNARPWTPDGVKTASDAFTGIPEELSRERLTLPSYMHRLAELMGGGARQGRIGNIIADTSVGKCFEKGTKIMMSDGSLKNVEDVAVGDKVMGGDGAPRNVLSLGRGSDEMYRIDQVSGVSYTVNSEHILSLRASFNCPGSKVMKGDIVNIGVKDYIALPPKLKRALKGYKADFTAMTGDKVKLPYLIGLWLADGCSSSPRITVGNKDVEIKQYIESLKAEEGFGTSVSPSADRSGCQTIYISGGFRTLLGSLNLLNNKHIPHAYKFASYEDRLALFAGIVDGDGYVSNNCIEVSQKSETLRDDILWVARSLGFVATYSTGVKRCQGFDGAAYHRICISGDVGKLPVLLPRRKVVKGPAKKTSNTSITVTPVGHGDYYGFTIDGDHLFCLEDYTVTHNTSHVRRMVYHWIMNSEVVPTVVSLEDTAAQYVLDLVSIHLEENLMWNKTEDEILQWLETEHGQRVKHEICFKEDGSPRFYIIDERSGNIKDIEAQMEVMLKKCGSKLFIIDVLSDLLRGSNEDKAEDHLNFQKGLVKEGVSIWNALHTRKPGQTKDGTPRKTSEYDALGTGSFVQSAAYNIVLTRDKLAEDPVVRNTTEVELAKCRGGKTGFAGKWYYHFATARCYDLDDWLSQNGPKDY